MDFLYLVFAVYWWFLNLRKLLQHYFLTSDIHTYLKEALFWLHEWTFESILAFGLVVVLYNELYPYFLFCNYDFTNLMKLVGNFLYVDVYIFKKEWFPTILMWLIQLSEHLGFWFNGNSS